MKRRRLFLGRVGWLVTFVLTTAISLASIPAYYDELVDFSNPGIGSAHLRANLQAAGISVHFYSTYLTAIHTVSAALWILVGVIIFVRRADEKIALLTSLGLLTFGAFFLNDGPYALAHQYPVMWLPVNLLAFCGSVLFYLFFYLFPDGRFVPRWMFALPILWAAHEAGYNFFPHSALDTSESLPLLDPLMILAFLCLGIGAQIYRYRRVSDLAQRQQTKWVVFGMVTAGSITVGFGLLIRNVPMFVHFGSPFSFVLHTGILVSMLLIPLSIGVSILRYRLWDVDTIINRTLVYGALTATVGVIYALIVGLLGALLQTSGNFIGNFLVSLMAAGALAVVFAPLREKLQRTVNRLMYGDRDEPYRVLSHLGQRLEATLEPKAVLPTIVDTVAGALKLPYAALAMKREDGFEVAATHGFPTGEEIQLPLNYAGEPVGRLVLAPRAPGETFSPADMRLLEDLGRHAEVAVQAVRLTADLQKSRERLVSAREEERRRLRRDLHDGLGPTLATLSLGLDVSLKILHDDPQEAESLMRRLKTETQDAVVDIRRLVYGLRPPALDDLGLVPAIREQASKHGNLADAPDHREGGMTGHKYGLVFFVEAPETLPPLSAAVEVACYRIAQEAITNVVRHSRASSCRVRLTINEAETEIELEVLDAGVGLPSDRRAGVGMNSMAERAAELGGTCTVAPDPGGGTRVLARLPLIAEEEE